MALTKVAHQIIKEHFDGRGKDIAVDATCGNGHDTEFLARQQFKQVLAFDVQERAIKATRHRLGVAGLRNVQLIHDGHENLDQYTSDCVDCVVFNLGYLPHGDKTITTLSKTSVQSLQKATELLADDGLITVLCYPGHGQGVIETGAIQNCLTALDSQPDQAWCLDTHLSESPSDISPILYTLTKSVS